jgi:exonuclease III
MRIVAWNIRAGGGARIVRIARHIKRWAPDAVVLCEFRATPPSVELARRLAALGLVHQCTTADRAVPAANRLLIAARWPLRRLRLWPELEASGRWLAASLQAPIPLALGAMHVPNRVTGLKYPFLDGVLACARRWRRGPALFIGDTNSGRRGLDEQVPAFNAREEGWIDGLAGCGWSDAFRHFRAEDRTYTWYSPNGHNGFRIDQAFVNAPLLARLEDACYVWAGGMRRGRRGTPSDHAALLVDLQAQMR